MQRVNDRLFNWASDIEQGTILQAEKTARLPIVAGHVALMPDAHQGMGATVGSVIPTKNAVIPSAVGVDIGCGMIATETDLYADDLPDDLDRFLPIAERVVPAGVGQGHGEATKRSDRWFSIKGEAPGADLVKGVMKTAREQFGSLGSGNHFFEVCLDENDAVWLVLHSGSRGVGNKLATAHIATAKRLARELDLKLEDQDLAYFTDDQPEFWAYIADMLWAQDYAMGNRQAMNDAAIAAFFEFVGQGKVVDSINCHHNFTQQEQHLVDGKVADVWVTRKGAIKADQGDRGVIPGSMGTRSYIVKGLGNPLSWMSCSHGAGRRMSRSQAKKTFTVDDLRAQMGDRAWLEGKAESLLDEIPSSYKDIDQVMDDQKDLVEIEHTLHQVLNFKGA